MESRRNISSQVFESATQESDSIFIPVLLDIYHSSITWGENDIQQENGHLRLVNDVRGMKYKGDDKEPKYYAPCTFTYKKPKEDGKKKNSASVSISCIDSRMIETIRLVPEDLRCRAVALYAKIVDDNGKVKYAFSKLDTKEFLMNGVTWDGITASWNLDPDEVMDVSTPKDTASEFRLRSLMEQK